MIRIANRHSRENVALPRWALWSIGAVLTATISCAGAWARHIDIAQGEIQQDVAALKQNRTDIQSRLARIENKVDELLRRGRR